MRIIFHCGLAKTGSTFLQENIFKKFNVLNDGIFYNPIKLLTLIVTCYNHRYDHEAYSRLKNEIRDYIDEIEAKHHPKILFCSYEPFVGGSSAWEFPERLKVISEVVPEAEIIVVLRHQVNWLVSLYKQYIHHALNPYKSATQMRILSDNRMIKIEQFLNYEHGDFGQQDLTKDHVNMSVKSANWNTLLECLQENFVAGRWHLFFYEDFIASPKSFAEEFMKIILGTHRELGANVDFDKRYNIGFSSKAVKLSAMKIRLTYMLPFRFSVIQAVDHGLIRLADRQGNDREKFKKLVLLFRRRIRALFVYFGWPNTMRTMDRVFNFNGSLLTDSLRSDLEKVVRKMNSEFVEHLSQVRPDIAVPEKYRK